MSRTDNTRPWKIRRDDPRDHFSHMSYCKAWERDRCDYCARSRTRKTRQKPEIEIGIEDYNWHKSNDLRIYGEYDSNPWADVHLRWHYPWGESRDEPVHEDWEDQLDNPA